jgi:redox-sensitive bicupin YhaK (pirin superfamily)
MRTLTTVIPSIPTSDGAGVQLRRSLGARPGQYLDPFLMLDEFYSDNADDYIAGFPSHPHRGFETVTYMLNGHMRHEDHLGNRGDLQPGDVQWMTAAGGIIHSEMPQQTSGRLRGFQLWINLPAREKLKAARYRDIPARDIPVVTAPGGVQIKVIAGSLSLGARQTRGPVNTPDTPLATDPLYLDLQLPAGSELELPLPPQHHAFLYLYEGEALVGSAQAAQPLPPRSAGVLSAGDRVRIHAGAEGARALLLAGRPIGEPVVQYGPFVMNTRAEIEQAIDDFRRGRLTPAVQAAAQ